MCMPIPIPYIPIQMEMCMVLFNVMQPGNNMHACMDLEFKMQNIKMMVRLNKPLLLKGLPISSHHFQILHFDCFRMGQNNAWLKPDDNGGVDEFGQIIQNIQLKQ